jgi:hypothetical protein
MRIGRGVLEQFEHTIAEYEEVSGEETERI